MYRQEGKGKYNIALGLIGYPHLADETSIEPKAI
jgi:hypothetical protein